MSLTQKNLQETVEKDPQLILSMLADHKDFSMLEERVRKSQEEREQKQKAEQKEVEERRQKEQKEKEKQRRKREFEEKRQTAVYKWLDENGWRERGCVTCGTVWKDMYEIGYGRVVCCPASSYTKGCYEKARQRLLDAKKAPFKLPLKYRTGLYGSCSCIIYSPYYENE